MLIEKLNLVMVMERVTKKIIKYTQQKWEDAKSINLFKMLRQEVEIGANGTQKYMIKEGKNKGTIL